MGLGIWIRLGGSLVRVCVSSEQELSEFCDLLPKVAAYTSQPSSPAGEGSSQVTDLIVSRYREVA